MSAKLRVSKLEAGRRQLETAIILYFNYGDPVSIHSLGAAADTIFRDLSERRGRRTVPKDLWQFVDKRAAKEFQRLINQSDNLFKHADNDPNGLELDPRMTEAVMLDAVREHWQLTGEQPPLLSLYLIWLVTQHPEIFGPHPEFTAILEIARPGHLYQDRHQYFVNLLPVAASVQPRPIAASVGAISESPLPESTGSADRLPLITFAEGERDLILRALERTGGNKYRAAKLLKISRKMLYNKVEKYKLFEAAALYREKALQRQRSSTGSNSASTPTK